jgi:2-haloacid dehalogenase
MAIAPTVALLDVNETLSDFNRLGERFEEVGAPAQLVPTWFAATLRDGMALTASGEYAAFRDVAGAVLRGLLSDHPRLHRPLEEAVEHVLAGIGTLPVQRDVPDGIRLLREAGMRVATLTNGAPAIAKDCSSGQGSRAWSNATSGSRSWGAGNPPQSRTGTPAGRWAWRRHRRC